MSWNDFKTGFGDQLGNYWIGNEHLYTITNLSCNCLLYINVKNTMQPSLYTKTYTTFSVSSESDGYALSLESPDSGSTWDVFVEMKGKRFSTYDRDNDQTRSQNCAAIFGVGWWYGTSPTYQHTSANCGSTNLNGNASYHVWYASNSAVKLSFSNMSMTCYDRRVINDDDNDDDD